MTRKRFSEGEVIRTLIYQGVIIPCYRCKVPFALTDDIEREHVTELALGGLDEWTNAAYSHRACHHKVTFGTKATTAGSSIQRVAKVRRLQRKDKPKMKRPWPAGRKMLSRPFQKRKP